MSMETPELDPVLAAAEFGCPMGFAEGKTMTLGEFAGTDFGKSPMGKMAISGLVESYSELRQTGIAEEDAISQATTKVFGQSAVPEASTASAETPKKK